MNIFVYKKFVFNTLIYIADLLYYLIQNRYLNGIMYFILLILKVLYLFKL